MKTIQSQDDVHTFVTKMQKGLSKGRLAGIVSFHDSGEEMVVQFYKLGTSKIHYKVERLESGFVARYIKENIFFAHNIFRAEVEKKLVDMMRHFGAEVD